MKSHVPKALAVICPPLGQEYMSSHRTLRHLADAFADVDVASIRMDYLNTGNSSDTGVAYPSMSDCIESVVTLCEQLQRDEKIENIILLGFGLGASIAFQAAKQRDIHTLVLWEPCIKGRRLLRELRLLSGVVGGRECEVNDVVGLTLTGQLIGELEALDLENEEPTKAANTIYLYRNDRGPSQKLLASLGASNTNAIQMAYEGYEGIVDFPTETLVPYHVINRIVATVSRRVPETATVSLECMNKTSRDNIIDTTVREELLLFGANKLLFGVLAQPVDTVDKNQPVILFLNCGSEHNVGPHRMYTRFSRKLAEKGGVSFRFDIEGIGDSFANGKNQDNMAYSPVAMKDIGEAIIVLKEYGFSRFILSGICAGAYHSFKAVAELDEGLVEDAILVNPLVFDWSFVGENGGEYLHSISEVYRYKSTFFKLNHWKKLLSCKSNIASVLGVFTQYAKLRAYNLMSRVVKGNEGPVIRRLNKIAEKKCRLMLVLSEGEPGYQILAVSAGKEINKLRDSGLLNIIHIDGGDHGLSKRFMQDELYRIIESVYLKNRGY